MKTIGISELVQQALTAGYLSVDAENKLRELLNAKKYDLQDMSAFMSLQLAAMAGRVRQESRNIQGTLELSLR